VPSFGLDETSGTSNQGDDRPAAASFGLSSVEGCAVETAVGCGSCCA